MGLILSANLSLSSEFSNGGLVNIFTASQSSEELNLKPIDVISVDGMLKLPMKDNHSGESDIFSFFFVCHPGTKRGNL
jgi:hypothetical protein